MTRPVILLVDDEPNVVSALKRVFRKEDYDVLSSTRPEEALDMLRQREVDVLITDQRMPGMTGVELLVETLKFRPDMVSMMLTGYTDLKSAEEAINKGRVMRFFLKPWSDDDVRNAVKQALNQIELRRENRRLLALTRQQNISLQKRGELLEKKVELQSKEIEETRDKLVQSDKLASLGMLAGGIAHEINNPLGGILTMAQLILEDTPNTTQTWADLKEIETAALHSKAIVENLLQFARQSRQPSMESVKLSEVIARIDKLLGHSLSMKNIRVFFEESQGLPEVWGNLNRLQQVFMNLISNAGQSMPGGGVIRVVAGADEGANRVWIKVIDNGVGIPADVLPKIFDPFFTTKAEGEGTGLGLSITWGILQDHGGTIEVESEAGKGSTFTVLLRVNAPEADSKQQTADSEQLTDISNFNQKTSNNEQISAGYGVLPAGRG